MCGVCVYCLHSCQCAIYITIVNKLCDHGDFPHYRLLIVILIVILTWALSETNGFGNGTWAYTFVNEPIINLVSIRYLASSCFIY